MANNWKGIIWDWNGTLLNDTLLCVHTINGMLEKRNLPSLSVVQYKAVFSFPVKDYYRKIGFDFEAEPFEIPAREFIDAYHEGLSACRLHEKSIALLHHFQARGTRQFILSAMKQETLDLCLQEQQINHFFEQVSGLDNHYAASKLDNGQKLLANCRLKASDLVLIGDTVHDFEVAKALGCHCILIANGHQSRQILEATGVQVLDVLGQLIGHGEGI